MNPAPSASPPPASTPYPLVLDALHSRAAPGRLVASPTGHVLASTVTLPDAPPGPLTRFGLAVAEATPESAFGEGPAADRFAAALLTAHRELLDATIAHALRHLEGRTSGDTTLLAKQLVAGQLADVALRLAEDAAVPEAHRHADRDARWRCHLRLVDIGRDLLRLLGASGFLADGPAGDLHLAEVLGNVYLHPDTEYADD
ncbi:hypothetical protein [Micromonospora endophytica]|uniref:Uncharacterized protein n=1 Tax=Micromonospora endophytica TaxID=515350 RepID=A0A2W2DTU7_9ACTN|nr:hypothetical protein [Micromonospora endophytica]PZG00557.1 hypothetical protein C1I93_02245 [Micromonospora endophytica]RIW45824.1 hypothetical protein D3H59_14020 [Micromonospora endophytica]BCJ61922.1 hypothetical protein Jiend_53440 [Micromonospora endophytica]